MAGGELPATLDHDATDGAREALGRRLDALHQQLGPTRAAPGTQVTAWMGELRAADLTDRRAAYRTHRAAEQLDFYRRRAERNTRQARLWTGIVAAAEAAALLLAVARGLRWSTFDWPGILGAVAAAGVAWQSANRHQFLADNYAAAANQVAEALGRLDDPAIGERRWVELVADIESIFEREHGLWLGNRG